MRAKMVAVSVLGTIVLLFSGEAIAKPRIVNGEKGRLGTPGDAPVYPVTGAWFRDRYTADEWNETLSKFGAIGGDRVIVRAPPLVLRSASDIMADPEFEFCGSYKSSTGMGRPHCVREAAREVVDLGLVVAGYATYTYEEEFSSAITLCPQYDRIINSSRIYHRLVLPLQNISSNMCVIEKGTEVLLVFTSFSGIDPHRLLVTSAKQQQMKVTFGLPSVGQLDVHLLPAYFQFVYRIVNDHRARYSTPTNLYDIVDGYVSTDEVCLAAVPNDANILEFYSNLGKILHYFGKKFVIAPYIILNRSMGNFTIAEHVNGFETLAKTGDIDIIVVQEGRGSGRGAYFWGTEGDTPIVEVDPVLDRIVRFLHPNAHDNVTFNKQFAGSNNDLFKFLRDKRDEINVGGVKFEYWLDLEAFEYLRDDPCLPIDPAGSGMAQMLDRTTKFRLDKSLTAAGAQPEKIVSFAWDPGFTCKNRTNERSLADDVTVDNQRPIIANCSFHSSFNRSVVVIGYNLMGLTQAFTINYPSMRSADRKTEKQYGYYYETDYGADNDRISSLVYIQLFDVGDVFYIPDHGNITVTAETAYHPCTFLF